MQSLPPSPAAVRARLMTLDALCLFVIVFAVDALRFDRWAIPSAAFVAEWAVFAALNGLSLYTFDSYAVDSVGPSWLKPVQTLAAVFCAGCAIVLCFYVFGAVQFRDLTGRGVLMGSQLAFALTACASRVFVARWGRALSARARWLVLGTSESIRRFLADVALSRTPGSFTVLGDLDDVAIEVGSAPSSGVSVIAGGACDALRSLSAEPWSGVIVAGGVELDEHALETLIGLRRRGIKVLGLADFYEQRWHKVPASAIERRWLAMSRGFSLVNNPLRLRAKRVFDLAGALTLLLLTLPVLVLAAIAIKLESPGPVLFKQVRLGEDDVPFTIFKLRSMRTDAEKNGPQWASQNDARVTRVGAFIRRTRIDELPQLFNVLAGSMSFVGPRPERPEFTKTLEHEIPFYSLRHMLKPGVTGWAQVMYPYGASIEDAREKLQYDLYYIKNHSLLLDLAIVIRTIRVVLFGVHAPRPESLVAAADATGPRAVGRGVVSDAA